MLDEFAFIEQIRRAVDAAPGVSLGIGDDCAALELPPGEQLLVTSDLLLEGVHFRRDWTTAFDLGAKAVAVNLSDLAAMGARPAYLVLGLGLPNDFSEPDRQALIEGFVGEAASFGVTLVGGDTCRAQQFLTLAVTAFGTAAAEKVLRRDGARVGERIFVSGTLGSSALALQQLQDGRLPVAELARRHHRPTPRVVLGQALAAAGATSMIDISDGLLADLGHLLKASGVGAEICTSDLPLDVAFRREMTDSPELLQLALAGGEDYELLFTLPAEKESLARQAALEAAVPITEIGRLLPAPEDLWLVDSHGQRSRPLRRGFNHFSTTS